MEKTPEKSLLALATKKDKKELDKLLTEKVDRRLLNETNNDGKTWLHVIAETWHDAPTLKGTHEWTRHVDVNQCSSNCKHPVLYAADRLGGEAALDWMLKQFPDCVLFVCADGRRLWDLIKNPKQRNMVRVAFVDLVCHFVRKGIESKAYDWTSLPVVLDQLALKFWDLFYSTFIKIWIEASFCEACALLRESIERCTTFPIQVDNFRDIIIIVRESFPKAESVFSRLYYDLKTGSKLQILSDDGKRKQQSFYVRSKHFSFCFQVLQKFIHLLAEEKRLQASV